MHTIKNKGTLLKDSAPGSQWNLLGSALYMATPVTLSSLSAWNKHVLHTHCALDGWTLQGEFSLGTASVLESSEFNPDLELMFPVLG